MYKKQRNTECSVRAVKRDLSFLDFNTKNLKCFVRLKSRYVHLFLGVFCIHAACHLISLFVHLLAFNCLRTSEQIVLKLSVCLIKISDPVFCTHLASSFDPAPRHIESSQLVVVVLWNVNFVLLNMERFTSTSHQTHFASVTIQYSVGK